MKEKILVIKHGALGDFVIASGNLRAVREQHPTAHITLITEAFLKDFAISMGLFDEIVVDSRGYNFATWYNVIKRTIADREWDFIFDFQSSNRTLCRYYPLALLATRHAMKWIYRDCKDGGFVARENSRKIPFLPWFWRTRKNTFKGLPADLSICKSDAEFFKTLPSRYALLIPGCSAANSHKRWPAEKYRELTKFLATKGLKSVVIGTKAEEKEIREICDGNEDAISLMGVSTIADLPQLAMNSKVVIGNDTGPSHMARFAKSRLVMLFVTKSYYVVKPIANEIFDYLYSDKIEDISFEAVCEKIEKVMSHD